MKYLLLALQILAMLACAPKPLATEQPSLKHSNTGRSGNPFGLNSPLNQGLSSRRVLKRVPLQDSTSYTGTVVVNLCVNRKGKVTSAEYSPKGSTTTNEHLIWIALENARQWRFEKSKVKKQCGDIKFNFVRQ